MDIVDSTCVKKGTVELSRKFFWDSVERVMWCLPCMPHVLSTCVWILVDSIWRDHSRTNENLCHCVFTLVYTKLTRAVSLFKEHKKMSLKSLKKSDCILKASVCALLTPSLVIQTSCIKKANLLLCIWQRKQYMGLQRDGVESKWWRRFHACVCVSATHSYSFGLTVYCK